MSLLKEHSNRIFDDTKTNNSTKSIVDISESFNMENSHNRTLDIDISISAFNRVNNYIGAGYQRVSRSLTLGESIIVIVCGVALYKLVSTIRFFNIDGLISIVNMAKWGG